MRMIYMFKGELKYVVEKEGDGSMVIVVVTLDSGARRGRLTSLGDKSRT